MTHLVRLLYGNTAQTQVAQAPRMNRTRELPLEPRRLARHWTNSEQAMDPQSMQTFLRVLSRYPEPPMHPSRFRLAKRQVRQKDTRPRLV